MAMKLGDGNSTKEKEEGTAFPRAFKPGGQKGLTEGVKSLIRPTFGGDDPTDLDANDPPLFIITGEKGSGKTCGFVGLPQPFGGKTYILTFDRATLPGLLKRYGADELRKRNVEIIDVVSKQYDENGEEVYRGYDPNIPGTAQDVVQQAAAWLEEIESRGDCDNLLLDHFEALHEEIGFSYAVAEAYGPDADPRAQLEFSQWGPRKTAARLILNKALNIRRFALGISGYGAEERLVVKKLPNRHGKLVNTPVYEVVQPRWVGPYKKPFTVTLDHKRRKVKPSETDEESTDQFVVEVVDSRHPLFRDNELVDLTGTEYSLFWKREEEAEEAMGG